MSSSARHGVWVNTVYSGEICFEEGTKEGRRKGHRKGRRRAEKKEGKEKSIVWLGKTCRSRKEGQTQGLV